MSPRALGVVLRELVAKNRIGYGVVYLQISRGVARRDPAFPSPKPRRAIVATARPLDTARNEALAAKGIAVVSVPDNRWGRVDIKTVGLLPNVLARQAALEQGRATPGSSISDGNVTEAASANAWIVTPAGTLVTRHADHAILRGITRDGPLDVIKAQGLTVEERAFHAGRGLCGAGGLRHLGDPDRACRWYSIDGRSIGDGKPGPVARRCGGSFTALRRQDRTAVEAIFSLLPTWACIVSPRPLMALA